MTNGIVIAKGISGSGKSSRVFQLIKYLESIGLKSDEIVFTNEAGTNKTVGLAFDEISLAFIGQKYNKDGVERWQGYDAVTSSFDRVEKFSEFILANCDKYTFVVEGAGITDSFRFRPEFLVNECGMKNVFVKYYNYEETGRSDYMSRIIYRTGKEPKTDVMWSKNARFVRDMAKTFDEVVRVDDSINCLALSGLFSEPISDLGEHILNFIGYEDEIPNFLAFVKEFDYININKFQS